MSNWPDLGPQYVDTWVSDNTGKKPTNWEQPDDNLDFTLAMARERKRVEQLEQDLRTMELDKAQGELEGLKEELLRAENEALKDAWEQYQILLRLSKK